MAEDPPKKRQELFHASIQQQRLQVVKVLHEHTPLPTVLQEVVAEFLKGGAILFASDLNRFGILAVDLENDNAVRVIAGKPYEEGHADGRGSEAEFAVPDALAVDPASGALLVRDRSCIRHIAPDGTVTTLCGDPHQFGYKEDAGSAALFGDLCGAGCAVIGKDLFVSDTFNHCIRRVPLDGSSTSLFAGSPGQPGCVGAEAKFGLPGGLCHDGEKNLIVADTQNNLILTITEAGVVTTLAGSGERGSQDGPVKEASFDSPDCVAYDAQRNRVLVSKRYKQGIRSIDLCSNQVSTIPLKISPLSLAVDFTGNIFVTTHGAIFRVSPDSHLDAILEEDGRSECYLAAFV